MPPLSHKLCRLAPLYPVRLALAALVPSKLCDGHHSPKAWFLVILRSNQERVMVQRKSFFERHNLVWVINSIVALFATVAVIGVGISAVRVTIVIG